MKNILDRSFRYVPSHATDLRKTFDRIRKERETPERPKAPAVVQLNRRVRIAPRHHRMHIAESLARPARRSLDAL